MCVWPCAQHSDPDIIGGVHEAEVRTACGFDHVDVRVLLRPAGTRPGQNFAETETEYSVPVETREYS